MAFRSLFVPALDPVSARGAVADAGQLLGQSGGYLRAHFATEDIRPPVTMADAVNLTALVEEQRAASRLIEREIHAAFDAACRDLSEGIETSFTTAVGEMPRSLARASRLCEAILFRHRGPDKKAFDPIIIEELLFRSGRPLILVPPRGLSGSFDTLAVAWNGSREATRALALAQPMIRTAEKVTFITIGKERPEAPTAEEMSAHMNACGTKCDVIRREAGKNVDQQLASIAIEEGAQALVVGAFSRSRLREIILGGVTRSFLEEPPLPLVIAH